jgi:hypothetical protein
MNLSPENNEADLGSDHDLLMETIIPAGHNDEGGEMMDGQDPANLEENWDDANMDFFHFIPLPDPPALGEAGPSPSTIASYQRNGFMGRALDEDADDRLVDPHPTAGHVLRMDSTLHC